MPVDVPLYGLLQQGTTAIAFLPVPFPHRFFVVQQVDRQFYKHRAGHAGAGDAHGLVQGGRDLPLPLHDGSPLDVGFDEGHLVDVLQGAPVAQQGGRSAAQQ